MTEITRFMRDMDGILEPDEDGNWCKWAEAEEAIETLKARVMGLEQDYSAKCAELALVHDSHDAALAKLQELEDQEPFEIDFPTYHASAMGCGLEDRSIRDRYRAMEYGWDCAIEDVAERLPEQLFKRPVPARTLSDADVLDLISDCKDASGRAPADAQLICMIRDIESKLKGTP